MDDLSVDFASPVVSPAIPRKRRRWTAAQKAQIVSETFQPGVKVCDVARRHGVDAKLVSVWRNKALEGKLALFDPRSTPDFVPLVVEADPAAICPSDGSGQLDVVVGDVTVRLNSAIDVARLAQIVRALNDDAA